MKKKTFATLVLLAMLAFCLCAGMPVIAEVATAPAQATVNVDLTGIVTAVLGILSTAITAYVVPWLRTKLGEEKFRVANIVLDMLVRSAEQIYGAGNGKEKLAYVKEQLERRGMTINIDEIEAAVYNLGHSAVLTQDTMGFTSTTEVETDEKAE